MGCQVIHGQTGDGGEFTAFVCSRGRGRRSNMGLCLVNGCATPAEVLCDWPVGQGKTCDRKLCRRCAKRVGDNLDYCPGHWIESLERGVMPVQERYLAFVDTETGGLEPGKSPIVEIATILTDLKLNEIARFEAKIKLLPGQKVDPKAAEINGYNEADWKDAVHFDEYKKFMAHHVKMGSVAIPVGHNVGFDRDMIDLGYYKPRSQFCPLGFRKIDTLGLAQCLRLAGVIQVEDLKLGTVAKALGIEHGKAHSAMADNLVSKTIFERFMRFLGRAKVTASPAASAQAV